jgi:hypothetical protein
MDSDFSIFKRIHLLAAFSLAALIATIVERLIGTVGRLNKRIKVRMRQLIIERDLMDFVAENGPLIGSIVGFVIAVSQYSMDASRSAGLFSNAVVLTAAGCVAVVILWLRA